MDMTEALESWTTLKNQSFDQGLASKHTAFQKLPTTTLGSCGNDMSIFIVILQVLWQDLKNMGQPVDDWMMCSHLLAGLDDRFQNHVCRTVTMTETPSFEKNSC